MPLALLALLLAVAGCAAEPDGPSPTATTDGLAPTDSTLAARLGQYATAALDPDLSALSDSARRALPELVAAVRAVDGVFWRQVWGERDSLLAGLSGGARRYAEINYGPYDRLDGDVAFVPGVGAKPPGAALYPPGATADEILSTADLYPERALTSPVTVVRAGAALTGVPYSEAFADAHRQSARHLRAAAALLPDTAAARALRLRADALLSDDYRAADRAWAALDADLDVVVGPTDTWEDGLLGRKTAHTGVVLVRQPEWTERAAVLAQRLPALLDSTLGVGALDGTGVRLEVADAAALAGDANAGPKPVALDLPNSPAVRAEAGARRVLLRNVLRAKAERVLRPVADVVLADDQRDLVTAQAAVGHAALHEAIHAFVARRAGLGPQAAALHEARADALALALADSLAGPDRVLPASAEAQAVTFVASAFRGVRLGAATPAGRAWLVVLDGLRRGGALMTEATSGGEVWRVVPERVGPSAAALAREIGAVETEAEADAFVRQRGRVTAAVADALDRLDAAAVPLDVVFEDGGWGSGVGDS